MILDDMIELKTKKSKYNYLDNLGTSSLHEKLKAYADEYKDNCDIELLNRIEMICNILKSRLLETAEFTTLYDEITNEYYTIKKPNNKLVKKEIS